MQLKDIIKSPCGIQFMLDRLELQSGFARYWLLNSEMMVTAGDIEAMYGVLRRFVDFITTVDTPYINTLLHKLQCVKDLRTTNAHLHQHAILDDIELFEIKHISLLAADVSRLLADHGMAGVVEIPCLDEVVEILDPDGMKIATFYVYDSYDERLKQLRAQMRKHPEQQEELLIEASRIEDEVRAGLSRRLFAYADAIEQTQNALALIDVSIAKARQMQQLQLCFPATSADGTSRYREMFHPQVKAVLAKGNIAFQPVDIAFGKTPTLITGANMGGKTVVLKTLTLCQYLFQFGFGIPATAATIAVKDEVYFCIGDEQSVEKGLSSFAAEMKSIDAVIKASRKQINLLALIDEPARTTNPVEGTALVSALLQVLDGDNVSLVMTTHYDIEPGKARCLRVKGFENGSMNYELTEVHDGEVPHEALNIAHSLGIDSQWLELAKQLLRVSRNTI